MLIRLSISGKFPKFLPITSQPVKKNVQKSQQTFAPADASVGGADHGGLGDVLRGTETAREDSFARYQQQQQQQRNRRTRHRRLVEGFRDLPGGPRAVPHHEGRH
uniref:(northern house mosquito) hypothetical protein n=1 Tax=Culex pipiens TaxID=7175 RepID=A0A8D8MBA7_CULPI